MAKNIPVILRSSKEKKLVTSEKNRYKALFEHSISALFIGKPDGSILEANDAACKMFGYTVEELRQLGREKIIASDTPGLNEKLKERDEKSGVTGELIGIRKNGERFWCEFSSSIFEGPNAEKLTSVMMIDISDKKEAELNLKLNEINRKKLVEELSRVFSSAPDIICTTGFDGYFKRINPAASELLGYSEEELLTQPFINFVHRDDVQKTVEEFSKIKDGKLISNLQNRYITKSGKIIWLSWSSKIFFEEKIAYSVAKDITKQKEFEFLHDQATRLARIGSWDVDVNTGEIYWSRITREIHEADPDFIPDLEDGIQFYKKGENREKITEAVKETMENGTPWDLELQIVTAKGNERWIRTIGEAEIVDGKCVRIYGSFQNINDRKEAQEKIINKTRQLDAVAKFNGLLIQEENWMKALEMCLEDFGIAALADRVYFFENDKLEEDDPVTNMKIEWVRKGVQPQIDNSDHHNLPFSEIHSFIQTLCEKRIYNHRVDEILDKEFKQFLQDQDIKSLLAFPVFTGGLFRGFIGFDDCTIRRVWDQEEVTFLETIVINLASAIENEDAKKQILYKSRLIEAIANINSTFLVYDDWMEALYQSFRIIGESVNADRVYYFENHTDPETDEKLTSQKLEWVKDKQIIQIDNPDLQNITLDVYDEFINQMMKQKAYSNQVCNIQDKNAKSLLESQNILSILIIPVYVNQQFHGFIGFDDCTYERKWTEEEIHFLKSLSTNLSHAIESYQADIELRDLYEELELKVKALAASNAELEQFAFVASHDLQEPLRMITSFLALIEQRYGDKLDEKGRSYIYYATDGARRMRNIILDLLDYSRIGKVEVEKSIVDLNEIIDVVISLNKKVIEEKGAQIIYDDLPFVYAVKNQIQQILLNLIQNAVHYQKPDQQPIIRITSEELSTEWKLSVEDNGIGIHSDYREKIFNIFQRLHSNEEYSGTGVGLAICKKIIEEIGGSIGVESEEDKGSTFYFTIPKRDLIDEKKES